MSHLVSEVTTQGEAGCLWRVCARLLFTPLIAVLVANGAARPSVGRPPADVALTDCSSIRIPNRLHGCPRGEQQTAIEQLEAAISENREPNKRACLRLKLAQILEKQQREIASESRESGETPVETSEQARVQIRGLQDRATEAASEALREATDSRFTAEAVYMLGNLHDWHGEYRAAIPFYERIVREYAKVDLEYIVSKDNRYVVLNSIANCYAALGERSRATESFLQALPLAETEGYREWAIHRALEYEPRLMSERFALPEGVREILLEIANRSAFWVTLNAGSGSKPDGDPIEVSYHLRGRADCRIDWYRMVYRVWQLPADDRVSENAEPAPLAPTEIARPTIAWSTEKTLDVWEGHRNHGIRAWVASPPNYHRTLWDLPFQTNRWPPDAEAESGLGLMPERAS